MTDLELFLKQRSCDLSLKDWQFKQLIEALEIYYMDIIKPDWAVQFNWVFWREAASRLTDDHASVVRTVTPSSCLAPSGSRVGHSDGTGVIRPCRYIDDDDLYACDESSWSAAGSEPG
jgi:hypothetical protein